MKQAVLFLALLLLSTSARSDASGAQIYKTICLDCHEMNYFNGEDEWQLGHTLQKIVDGEIKHKKKLTLTKEEIEAVARFMSTGS